jgi:C-terminal processing protease CtpA/Prc
MKSVISILAVFVFSCSSTIAADLLQGNVEKTEIKEQSPPSPPQRELKGNTSQQDNSLSAQQAIASPADTVTSNPTSGAHAEGGEEAYGCLGAAIEFFSGTITRIFPNSDLNRFGIQPGDRVLSINGHSYATSPLASQEECRGIPGSLLPITIIHDGHALDLTVKRTDVRQLAPFASYFKFWADQTKQW